MINSTLYAMTFAARKGRDTQVQAVFHDKPHGAGVAQIGGADPGVSDSLRYLESAVITRVSPGPNNGSTYQAL